MPVDSRIVELRRRVQNDPASIAFAQLAEEYRRAGHYHDAIRTCRAGLALHPGYLSARVTLGRALIEIGLLDDAQRELELVVRTAPENLAAVRALADISHRRTVTAPEEAGRWEAVLDIAPVAPPQAPGGESRARDFHTGSAADARALRELEAWLAAIVRDREKRSDGSATLG